MIIDFGEAIEIDPRTTHRDLLSLEKAIIVESNNHFRLSDVYNPVTQVERDGTLHIQGRNYIQVADTVEVRGIDLVEGIYYVEEVGDGYVKLDIDKPLRYSGENLSGRLYIVDYPYEVAKGARQIIDHLANKKSSDKEKTVKSKSVGRVRYEYVTDQPEDEIHGAPSRLWGFLENHKRLRWG